MPGLDDEYATDLRQRAVEGDPLAWQALIALIEPWLHSIIQQRVKCPHASHDVTQEVLLIALCKLGDVRENLKGWLCTIALNVARRHLRKMSRERTISIDVQDANGISRSGNLEADQPEPGEEVELIEAVSDVRQKARKWIPEERWICFNLKCVQGLTVDQVADIMDLSPDQVTQRVGRIPNDFVTLSRSQKIPSPQRDVYRLKQVTGFTFPGISEKLKLSDKKVRSLYRKAKAQLELVDW